MEKEQIVKAMECCTRKPRANCKECPYALAEDRCMVSKLQRDSLSLIREQEKRIEEVKAATVRKMADRLKDRYEFDCNADEDNALYFEDLCEWVERIEKELLEENT